MRTGGKAGGAGGSHGDGGEQWVDGRREEWIVGGGEEAEGEAMGNGRAMADGV